MNASRYPDRARLRMAVGSAITNFVHGRTSSSVPAHKVTGEVISTLAADPDTFDDVFHEVCVVALVRNLTIEFAGSATRVTSP
jgi:hypothetical protein